MGTRKTKPVDPAIKAAADAKIDDMFAKEKAALAQVHGKDEPKPLDLEQPAVVVDPPIGDNAAMVETDDTRAPLKVPAIINAEPRRSFSEQLAAGLALVGMSLTSLAKGVRVVAVDCGKGAIILYALAMWAIGWATRKVWWFARFSRNCMVDGFRGVNVLQEGIRA